MTYICILTMKAVYCMPLAICKTLKNNISIVMAVITLSTKNLV